MEGGGKYGIYDDSLCLACYNSQEENDTIYLCMENWKWVKTRGECSVKHINEDV